MGCSCRTWFRFSSSIERTQGALRKAVRANRRERFAQEGQGFDARGLPNESGRR
jgi:hypothetical protein